MTDHAPDIGSEIAEIVALVEREASGVPLYWNIRTPWAVHGYIRRAEELAARLDPGASILDFGCGAGLMSFLLTQRGFAVTAVDVRRRDMVISRTAGVEPAMVASRGPLPFDAASFDAVVAVGVLEHVADPHERLRELRRVLRPGGRLFILYYPNGWSWIERAADLFHDRASGTDDEGNLLGHDRKMSQHGVAELIRGSGFRVEHAETRDILPRRMLTMPGFMRRQTVMRWQRTAAVERALGAIPGLRRIGSNVNVVARRPEGEPDEAGEAVRDRAAATG